MGEIGFVFQSNGSYDWTLIGQKSPQEPQYYEDLGEEILVEPEDRIAVRCMHYNPTNEDIQVGGAEIMNDNCKYSMLLSLYNSS